MAHKPIKSIRKKSEAQLPKMSEFQWWVGVYEHGLVCDDKDCKVNAMFETARKQILTHCIQSGVIQLSELPEGTTQIAQKHDGGWYAFTVEHPAVEGDEWLEVARLDVLNWQDNIIEIVRDEEE